MVTKSQPDPIIAAITLLDQERRALSRRHPEMAGYSSAIVVVAMPEADDYVLQAIAALCASLTTTRAVRFETLVSDHLSHNPDLWAQQAALREAQSRCRVINEVGAYTGAELADMNGSKARDRTKLAQSWKAAGRVFAVSFRGRDLFLSFQFDPDGRPLTAIRSIVRAFDGWGEWAMAGWFLRPNGLLHNERPVDLVRDRAAAVCDAAENDARRRRSLGLTKRVAPSWSRDESEQSPLVHRSARSLRSPS
jgi:hypothetical protein